MTVTQPPPLPVPLTMSLPGNDFPDWLSPIVVKELRQGLKSRAFVLIFVLVQVAMAVTFLLTALSGERASGADGFFWFLLWLPLVLVMPARALRAISDEHKMQTLELVQMTRMRSLRIAFGKWLAISVQTLLLTLALLPYFVLRYFFGGVNLADDVAILGGLLAASLVLTAAGLAASSLNTGLRIVAAVGAIGSLLVFSQAVAMFAVASRLGMPTSMFFVFNVGFQVLSVLVLAASYVLFFLLLAAGHLSTQTETYTPEKRMLALTVVLITLVAWGINRWLGFDLRILTGLLPIALWTMVEALVEKHDSEWRGASRLRRGLAPILRPGWASGFFFSLVIFVGVGGLIAIANPVLSDEERLKSIQTFGIAIGAVLTPALLLLRLPNIKQRVLFYWLIHLLFGLAFLVMLALALRPEWSEEGMLAMLAPLPPAVLLACLHQDVDFDFVSDVFPITAVATALIFFALLFLAFRTLMQKSSLLHDEPQEVIPT